MKTAKVNDVEVIRTKGVVTILTKNLVGEINSVIVEVEDLKKALEETE